MRAKMIDIILMSVTIVLMLAIIGSISYNVYSQSLNYQSAMTHEFASQLPSKTFILSMSRSLDYTLVRSSGMLFGALLSLLGALYLFKLFDAQYDLNAGISSSHSINLKTSSPGLVMLTLGVFVTIGTLYDKSQVNYSFTADNNKTKEHASSTPEATKGHDDISIPSE